MGAQPRLQSSQAQGFPIASDDVGGAIRRRLGLRPDRPHPRPRGCRSCSARPVVIENVSGAGGMTAAARVAHAPPDGYQFVLGSVDTIRHQPVALQEAVLQRGHRLFPDRAGHRSGAGADRAQGLPGERHEGVHGLRQGEPCQDAVRLGGVGSASHLTCARINAAIGVEVTHVTYRGSAQAMQDLFAGRIDYYCALGRRRGRPAGKQAGQGHRHPDSRPFAAVPRACQRE